MVQLAFRQSHPGFCYICHERIPSALDVHIMNVHLEVGQLWRCPVEWCAVWKGTVSECLGHLQDKHGGSQYISFQKFFPPWTVPRDLWQTAFRPDVSGVVVDVRSFHESRCRLGHKYPVYKDPFPHPALWGGGGVLPRLLSFVTRAMAIAQLTNLHISIPKSGAPPGEVPVKCFPPSVSSQGLMDPRRVSFVIGVTVLGDDPILDRSPDIQIHPPVCPDVVEVEEMDSVEEVLDKPVPVIRPPPGFQSFSWPREEWSMDGGASLFDFSRELPGWLSGGYDDQSVDPPSLPISLVLRDSLDDSVAANVGSSREDSNTISEDVVAAPTVMKTLPVETDSGPDAMMVLSSPEAPGPFFGVAGGRGRRYTKLSDWACEATFSRFCSSLEVGSGGPLPCRTFTLIDPLLGCRKVAAFVVSKPGNGCGYPATLGCLFDGLEFGRT